MTEQLDQGSHIPVEPVQGTLEFPTHPTELAAYSDVREKLAGMLTPHGSDISDRVVEHSKARLAAEIEANQQHQQ